MSTREYKCKKVNMSASRRSNEEDLREDSHGKFTLWTSNNATMIESSFAIFFIVIYIFF